MRWWIKLLAALVAIVVLLWLIVRIISFTLGVFQAGESKTERDPMFAEEMEIVTPPPELGAVEGVSRFDDNSANWDTSVQTPVDQTAEELGEAARNGQNG